MATVARADLPAEVVALGRLTGLLTVSGDTVTIEAGWFDDPASALRGVPDRLDALVELIGGALGPAEAGAPPEPAGAQWYRLPNPLSGAPTPFCVVTPPATAASGEIGTGVLVPIEVGSVRVVPSAYARLVSYRSGGGADVAFAKPDHPCRLGVRVERTDRARFAVNGTSFTALDLALEIDLSGADPSFTLRFEDLSGNPAGTSDSYSRLADLGDPNVLAWIGDVVTEGGNWLCLAIGGSNVTAGEILAGAGFMTYDSTTALYHAQLDEAFKRTPAENLLAFLFGTLSALASADFPVVNLPGGGVYVDHDPATGDYGVRFSTALTIGGGPATGGKASPSVDLCLGTAFTGETDETNWISRTTGSTVPAGLSAFLVRKAGDGPIELAPRFRLGSAGVNVRGGGGPLVDIGGYTIGGVEARAYFDTHGLGFGFGARIDAVGFPLGQSFGQAQGAGGNPVAGDLLASGNSAPQADGTSAANPAFSAEAGWVEGHPPMLEVLDPQGRRTDVVWFPIQRRLGPLHCSKVGLRLAGAGSGDPVVGVHVRRPTDPSA